MSSHRTRISHGAGSPAAFALVALLLLGCGGDEQEEPAASLPLADTSFVLVHGAWNAAWVWSDVVADLEAQGADVTTVELPGHGDDATPVAEVSLESYVAEVTEAIEALGHPVVLVGHSLGGIVITQAAEDVPDQIDKLVYVTAFVPKNGQSLFDLATADATSDLGPALALDMERGIAAVDQTRVAEIFCGDCSDAMRVTLAAKYRDEPLLPLVEPVTTSDENWGRVSKFYVYAALDHVITPTLQAEMTAEVTFTDTAAVETGHSPFLSQPDSLAAALAAFAEE